LHNKLPWWIAALSLALLAAGGLLLTSKHGRQRSGLEARIAGLEGELQKLRAAASTQPAPVAEPQAHPAPRSRDDDSSAALEAFRADAERRVASLQEELKQALAKADKFDLRAQQLDLQLHELTAENKRLAASEHEVSEDLSRANRVVNALEAQLKAKNERMVQLEVANAKLKEDHGADAQRANEFARLAQELQEVHRRREVYLTSLLRRYREVTDQYRSLSAVVDPRRDTETPAVNSTDIARIQQAISMAEDDLRQVNSLNAQAQRIQRQLAAR
jgi:chromosome segregation ATPase